MHILQVSPRVPFPLHDGGAIGIYNITAGLLRAGHRVTMLAINTPKHHQPAGVLDHLGPNFRLVTVDVDTNLKPWRALRNLLFSHRPYNVERFISSEVSGALVALIQAENFDVIQYEGTFVAWYHEWLDSEELTPERAASVLRAHNIEYVIWERLAQGEKNPAKRRYLSHLATRLRSFEKEYLWCFDGVAAITEEDIARLKDLGCPEPIALIPAAVEMSSFQPDPAIRPRPRTVFMIGSLNWLPNREGLEWLLREVWPAVHAELPDLELHVAGTGTPPHLLAPRADNVFMHGFVDSAAAFMRRYDLMLVPLLSGGGMRVKIIEGMALGKAILSTGLGAEGIAVRDGHDAVLRDGAPAWQAALRDYYHGRLPTAAIGAAAAATAAAVYDNRRVTERFEALYARLGAGAGAAAPAG
ncbi:glycosyltransferase family 4 protein [Hymenobacter caeli]|uniref:Glycosyltransferase involved in cell wall biosynthesis n=1 Tax=Hymenobacter caeli TaxID=2735894 RepID=A0ABX2FUR9_9BACT|nr:glycosyltransferase family 4 protein [Hymenobacter caeli]NRT20926.1 glycosyltransferase involved in cell wall biosynthesis [Hymenobacter caeli]